VTEQSFSANKNNLRIELPKYESTQIRFCKMNKEGYGAGEQQLPASEGKSSDVRA
jgi:hypothetical protein